MMTMSRRYASMDSVLIESISKINKKRWHKALGTIFISRALFSHFKTTLPATSKATKVSPAPLPCNSVVIDVVKDHPLFPNFIDQAKLSRLVKEKKMEHLAELGGITTIASSLKTDLRYGIHSDDQEISSRYDAFGTNTCYQQRAKSFFSFVVEAFRDPTILILLACAALSLGFGMKQHGLKEGWYEGGSIFMAVFLVISISAISNFWQNRRFDKLYNVTSNIQVEVVRSGRSQQISVFEIVVGDIVCLKIGDQIPADGLFLDGHSLQIDESSMTGESDHVEVNSTRNPFLISGTKVAHGYATMLVTSVGVNTLYGEMMSTISRDTNEGTPLESKLKKLTSWICTVGLVAAILVFVVRCITGSTEDGKGNTGFIGKKIHTNDIINAVIRITASVVPIVVASIPEGLPLAAKLTLTYLMKRMVANQAVVRRLSACKTMGSATTICTDKTGTLTMNKRVTKFWLGQESMEESSTSLPIEANVLALLHEGVSLNTTGSVYKPSSGLNYEFSGSPTEKAILSWAVLKLKMDSEGLKQSYTLMHMAAFNSEKKRRGVLMKKNADNTIHVHWKGAAEMILTMCSHYYNHFGELKPLDDTRREKFEQLIQDMTTSSLRCIGFAFKKVTGNAINNGDADQTIEDKGLVLLGLIGIKDVCRPGVKKAVEDCQYAGVNIKMITGESVFTARAIATDCGILGPDQVVESAQVVEGVEFRSCTHEERMEKVDKICVMARASPYDKLLMVQCLKKKGHVVAIIGDGTNDAQSLKEADRGISMQILGTNMAKESSDIVITDNNFASVVTVLRWGRCVYDNIQNFIQFQLTENVAALVINFVAAVTGSEVPITAVQQLWVNLIMDTLGTLALANEHPTKELMEKRPVGHTEPLITNIMWRNLIAQASYQIVIILTMQLAGKEIFNVSEKVRDTLIFNTFVLCQVFNEFNARKPEKKNIFEGIHRNKVFSGIIGITMVLQVVMVELLYKYTDTERLNWRQWGVCVGLAAVSWPVGWLVKFVPVPEKPFFSFLKWQNLKFVFKRESAYIRDM